MPYDDDLDTAPEEPESGVYSLFAFQGTIGKQPFFLGVTSQNPEDRLNALKLEMVAGKRPQVTLCLAIEALWLKEPDEDVETVILSTYPTKTLALLAKKDYAISHKASLDAALRPLLETTQSWSVFMLGDDSALSNLPKKQFDKFGEVGLPFYVMISQHTAVADLRVSLEYFADKHKKGRGGNNTSVYIKRISELTGDDEDDTLYHINHMGTYPTKVEAQNRRVELIEEYKNDGITTLLNSRYTMRGVKGDRPHVDYRDLWRKKRAATTTRKD